MGKMPMRDIEIIYRDDDCVAIDKPSGLAVHRGWARGERFAMTELRDLLGQWVYPVHRLDQSASGVLLFGLSPSSARTLCNAFAEQRVHKRYVALVRGNPSDEQLIDHPLRPDDDGPAQPAQTRVRRLAQWGRYAWVEARPKTGRLHQIRRHLKHVSCPIIGDVRYGKGEHNRLFREHYQLHRLALHAAELVLDAPGKQLHLQAPVPPDLSDALRLLESEHPSGALTSPPY
jgi:tRNA pseudouridine65 synthase